MTKKGFTLIELLVVIAILAILMAVVVIAINPAEMLKKTRDTKRISDLDALRTALNLYITDQGNLGSLVSTNCYLYGTSFTPSGITCTPVASTSQAVNGTGWIPIDFSDISSGNPLSTLPVDPKPNPSGGDTPAGWHAYILKADGPNASFKLFANMESNYYSYSTPTTGSGDVESKDGGTLSGVYEIGSDMSL